MLSSFLKDLKVYSKDMVELGKVKDLEFDVSEMKVTNFIVEFEKDAAKDVLGKMIVIRHAKGKVPAGSIESIKDAVNLKQPRKDLNKAFESL
ncbi:MAG: PRC-barrel domain-containing protein [Candidatus Bathyarchaeia archaeon]|jgi:sporulation protein YlmC with PRC-barrel domain